MNIVTTIIPIFAIIILGWFARWKEFIPFKFLGPANRLVYYLAIPAMIFYEISKASLKTRFGISVLGITLIAVMVVFVVSWSGALISGIRRRELGTFVQSSFHGNLGYISLAVAYYSLGNEGFVRAGIIAGFIMILQNFLSVVVLQLNLPDTSVPENKCSVVLRVLGNPVILSAIGGILFSLTGLRVPIVIDRSLNILSGLALPMALLLIGASLSFELMHLRMLRVLCSSVIKLLLLPGLGFILYRSIGCRTPGLPARSYPVSIATATITYVMEKEMNGDADFAVAALSTSTILSAMTFSLWLHISGR